MSPFDDGAYVLDDLDDAEVVYAIAEAVVDHLDEPIRMSAMVDSLVRGGDLVARVIEEIAPAVGGDRQKLDQFVRDTLWDRDEVWITGHDDDPWLASSDALMSDVVLTHRLTADEVDAQEVPLVPNLIALDYRSHGELTLCSGGTLRVEQGAKSAQPGEDTNALRGPDGWLAGLGPGDLVAFRRRGFVVDVERVTDLVPDYDVVAALEDAADQRIPSGSSEEAFPLVLDALTTMTDAFHSPVRPLDELLGAAGLERRGSSWGRQGEEWIDAAQQAAQLRRKEIARTFGFDSCCLAAFDRVLGALRGDADLGTGVARDLGHSLVASAVAEEILRFPNDSPEVERLVELGTKTATSSGPTAAAGHVVLALVARHRGDPLAAEAQLQQAQQADPDYEPAMRESARCHLDRGALDQVAAILRRVDSPFPTHIDDLVTKLRDLLTSPYSRAGRNDPCPCGSGRKYKVCCLRDRKIPPGHRASMLDLKLAAYVHDRREHDLMITAFAASGYDPEPTGVEMMFANPLVADLVAFEAGAAQEYLDKRGEVLPAEEVTLLQAAISEPRRLWEVVAVDGDTHIQLHDSDTGRSARIDDPGLGRSAEVVGTTLLWRIVRVGDTDYPVGSSITVFPDDHDAVRTLLATEPNPGDIARWYGAR